MLHHLSSMGMFMQCRILGGMFWHLQSLGTMLWHLQSIEVIFSPHLQSLNRGSLQLQRLVGITEILMSGYSAMHPWYLSYVASEYWCNFNASASVNVKCWRGFMAKMNDDTTSVWMKCWHDFMAKISIGIALMQIKCQGSFMAKEEC